MNPIIELQVTVHAPVLAEAIYQLAEAFRSIGTAIDVEEPPMTPAMDIKTEEIQKTVDAALERIRERNEAKEEPTTEPVPEPEPESVPVVEPEPQPVEPEPEGENFTVEDVRAALGDLSKTKGREVAKAILDALGARSVSQLKPEQYAEAMKRVREA